MAIRIPNNIPAWSPKYNLLKLWERNTGKKILNHGELGKIKTNF